MNNNEPIFIVGAPRSGTTLLAAMLANHSQLCCGPESHIFNKLNLDKVEELLTKKDWVERCYNELTKVTLGTKTILELYSIDKKCFESFLFDKKPTLPSLIDAILSSYSNRYGKKRWIEKTPNHILYLDKIREYYPNAKIIRIMRDPRDSVYSMKKIPWTSHSFVENSITWMSWYKKSYQFLEKDSKSLTIRYEDLVTNPEKILKEICSFIDENFEHSMLDTSSTGLQISTNEEPWKRQVTGPIDISRIYSWKKNLEKKYIIFSKFYFDEIIEKYNYDALDSNNIKQNIAAFGLLIFRLATVRYKKLFNKF